MPYDDPDPQDPNVLVGVSLPGDETVMREMAAAFADEFARLGHDEEQLLRLFRHPYYAGAHRAWRALGEPFIRQLVGESVRFWGRYRVTVKEESCPK